VAIKLRGFDRGEDRIGAARTRWAVAAMVKSGRVALEAAKAAPQIMPIRLSLTIGYSCGSG
jgi:hypothetical protein